MDSVAPPAWPGPHWETCLEEAVPAGGLCRLTLERISPGPLLTARGRGRDWPRAGASGAPRVTMKGAWGTAVSLSQATSTRHVLFLLSVELTGEPRGPWQSLHTQGSVTTGGPPPPSLSSHSVLPHLTLEPLTSRVPCLPDTDLSLIPLDRAPRLLGPGCRGGALETPRPSPGLRAAREPPISLSEDLDGSWLIPSPQQPSEGRGGGNPHSLMSQLSPAPSPKPPSLQHSPTSIPRVPKAMLGLSDHPPFSPTLSNGKSDHLKLDQPIGIY